MNNPLKKGLLFLSILMIAGKISYSQETMFEFGTSTTMDEVLSNSKAKREQIKMDKCQHNKRYLEGDERWYTF